MKLRQLCMAFAVAAATFSVAPAIDAQQAQPAEKARAQKPEPVTGELVALNPATKTLVVRTAPENDVKFTYSDETEIVGVDGKGVEGLTGKPGTMVTVTYDVHGTANIALKIEVSQKP